MSNSKRATHGRHMQPMRSTAACAIGRYDRSALARLAPIAVADLDPASRATRRIVDGLSRALRRERANIGRPSYDLARHAGLTRALAAETERLAREELAERRRVLAAGIKKQGRRSDPV